MESALGTDPNKADTDGDSYADGQELLNGYNILGQGRDNLDQDLAKKLDGKILLQVESKGEAWYVYQGKRYYLPDGAGAYKIMRFLSVGITDNDLGNIDSGTLSIPIKVRSDENTTNSNNQRRTDINTILNAIYQWEIDNNGAIPSAITTSSQPICRSTVTPDSCNQLGGSDLSNLTYNESYLSSLPVDADETNTDLTGYYIKKTSTNHITVTAPHAEGGEIISVTR